jgi:GGDEF domain-containing protein
MQFTWNIIGMIILFSTVATALGFLAGIVYEKWWTAGALERASKQVSKAVEHLILTLDTAYKSAHRFESLPGRQMSPAELQRMQKLRDGITQSLTNIQSQIQESLGINLNGVELPTSVPVLPQWVLTPTDSRTELPDYAAATQNLEAMIQVMQTGSCGALMLIQVDRFEDLGRRYGNADRTALLRSLSKLVIRHSQHQDLLCHLSDDLLLLFMPGAYNQQQCLEIRDTLRDQRYYLESSNREVLVTASYGVYAFSSGDTSDVALQRVTSALKESRKKGRNQLHVHNGKTLVYCKAS